MLWKKIILAYLKKSYNNWVGGTCTLNLNYYLITLNLWPILFLKTFQKTVGNFVSHHCLCFERFNCIKCINGSHLFNFFNNRLVFRKVIMWYWKTISKRDSHVGRNKSLRGTSAKSRRTYTTTGWHNQHTQFGWYLIFNEHEHWNTQVDVALLFDWFKFILCYMYLCHSVYKMLLYQTFL